MDISKVKTSWSDDHLLQLTDPSNHRIRYDRVGYIWEHCLDGKWSLHSIFKYRSHAYYYHLIKFWVYNWSRELMDRRISLSNGIVEGFESLYRDSKEIKRISEDKSLSTREKFGLIDRLLIFCRNDAHVHTGEFTVEKKVSETFGILVHGCYNIH